MKKNFFKHAYIEYFTNVTKSYPYNMCGFVGSLKLLN